MTYMTNDMKKKQETNRFEWLTVSKCNYWTLSIVDTKEAPDKTDV